MLLEIMSSDESGTEDGNEVIITHPLPWLTTNVQHFKKTLDEASMKEKSPQAKRMIKSRMTGTVSSRPQPTKDTIPVWILNNN